MTAAKAVWGGVVAFIAPGAVYLLANMGDGISADDLIGAALSAIVTAGGVAGTVYAVENRSA